ncbi:2-oxoacid dehydrogenases acyltransferase-domain-containing protein [Entophlyctis helioformis]|nr:2-oxoacid dehydrogenases acyltransferase-domain-containing protein [Entophlyctis helioformis]
MLRLATATRASASAAAAAALRARAASASAAMARPAVAALHTLSSNAAVRSAAAQQCAAAARLTLKQAVQVQQHRAMASANPVVSADGVMPFMLADIGEGITECEVIQWFVKEGDRVEQFSKICEVQSDKASVEITSRYDGVIKKIYYKTGDVARVGHPLVDIQMDGAPAAAASAPAPAAPAKAAAPAPAKSAAPAKAASASASASAPKDLEGIEKALTYATPAVRRVAKEHNVDLRDVVGSGPNGRVLKGDVIAFVNGEQASSAPAAATHAPAAAAPRASTAAADETVPLTPIQKAMFKAMTKSLQIPHFGFSDEITLDATTAFRKTVNEHLKTLPAGTYPFNKISYMPIFLKALSTALREFPVLNACVVDGEAGASQAKLLFRGSHNIGIAMDTPQGLIVPNIKNVQDKSIFEVAADIERLKQAGKKGGISPADLQGGTITLSNIGNIGGTLLHPVLVSSEVCIGAIGRVQRLPRFETVFDPVSGRETERVVAKEILNVSFNADHRVIDGATVGRFVQLWKSYLENPAMLAVLLK